MEWGDLDASKPVPTPYLNSPEKLNLLRLTVPAGFEGTIDVPLMLYDVQGEPSDSIRLSNRNFQLANNDLFDFFNVQDRIGNRVQSLSVSNNSAPIEISYLFNGELTKIQDQNTIEIGHLTTSPADIAIELQGPVSRRWDLDGLQATKDFAFEGSQYVDLSSDRVSELFDGNDAFEMTARVKLNASDATRRPIADAYRFSLEVDAENRPYVYYRSVDNQWTSLRGPVLTTGEWHNIAVSYDAGKLTLAVDNSFYETRVGQPLDLTYPQKGLFIGKSEHTGGLFFEGEMADFTMREITGSDHDRPQELVATVQLMNDAIGVQSTDDDDSEVPNAADPETFGFDWRRYLTALFTGSSRR